MRLAFAGGGTGGHLFPGLALARHALAEEGVESVVFFGARRGIETRLVPQLGFELIAQDLKAVRGGGPVAALASISRLIPALLQVRSQLIVRRIDLAVGLGGYASAAGVLGARMAGVPVVLLEQNLEPGLANSLLAKFSAAVCTSFAGSERFFPARRCHFTGNPLRPELEQLPALRERDTILVFGGSGGAHSLNRAAVTALCSIAEGAALPAIVHQSGADQRAEVTDAYREAGLEAEVVDFIEDMPAVSRRARLALCRAGATTVAELAATSTPAILLPYPHATGDHQLANARALLEKGAAVVVRDDDGAVLELERTLKRLLSDPERLDSMSRAAGALARPGAAARIMDVVYRVLADV
mgnify:CR=1 FL=1